MFHRNVDLPLKNLPVVALTGRESPEQIREKITAQDVQPVLAMPGIDSPGYEQVASLAEKLVRAVPGRLIVALETDMAKALGQQLALRMGTRAEILCIDRVRLDEGSYLDVGAPVGPALPVVVKTLILNR